MRIKKIVDTIENYGAAEHYITFNANFQRFLRNKFKVREIKDIDALDIVKKYKLRGIVFGNYVTQEERFFFLFKISKQIEAIAKIRGNNDIGKGVLLIAFGVEGKARSLAHFNPKKLLINLNRGRKENYNSILQGETSFIHEYGHFLDFIKGRKNKTHSFNFDSQAVNSDNLFSEVTRIALNDDKYVEALSRYRNFQYLVSEVEIFARLFEASITHYVHNKKDEYSKYFDLKDYSKKIYYPAAKIKANQIEGKIIKILKT